MKLYPIISKLIFSLSLIGIVLLIVNYFTGIINTRMTGGATIISLSTMIIAMIVTSRPARQKVEKLR